MDRWHGLTLAQIRLIEEETQRALDEVGQLLLPLSIHFPPLLIVHFAQMRKTGDPRGMTASEH